MKTRWIVLLCVCMSNLAAANPPDTFSVQDLCEATQAPAEPEYARRLHTLCHVWNAGSRVPVATSLAEFDDTPWHEACSIINGTDFGASDGDRVLLRESFGDPAPDSLLYNALCYYALLDHDADGIRDFRLAAEGRLVENDDNIDRDRVPNALDVDALADGNRTPSRLPARLQFECEDDFPRPCEIQRELFDDHRLTLINRTFDENSGNFRRSVQTVDDTVRLVFGAGMPDHPGYDAENRRLQSLRTVFFEYCGFLDLTPWNTSPNCYESPEWELEASAAAHNRSFTVHSKGAAQRDFVRLGIFAHELAHSWSFALDYKSATDVRPLMRENHWIVPTYQADLESFRWELPRASDAVIQQRLDELNLLVGSGVEVIEYDTANYRLEGKLVSDVIADLGGDDVDLLGDEAKAEGFFGTYAFSDPWEWYADGFLAYLYQKIERHFTAHSSARQANKLKKLFRAHVLDVWQGFFYHPNLPRWVFNRFDQEMPISDADMTTIVCRYIVKSDLSIFGDAGFYSQEVAGDIDPVATGEKMRADWATACADVE